MIWAGFVAYLGALAWAPRLGKRVIWGAIVLLLVLFVCLPPLLSHDVYSYVDYARLGALHGVDPYLRGPAAVPSDAAFSHVDWPHTTSVYGLLFTLATYPLAWLPVEGAVYALKGAAAAAVLGTAVLVARLSPARGIDPIRAAAFVALNPLVLVHVVGGPHNDAYAVLLMTLGVGALLSRRELSGGAALFAAVATKATAAVVLPFALVGASMQTPSGHGIALRPVGRLVAGGALAATVVGAVAWLGFGWGWLHALALVGQNQGHTSHLSIPTTVARIIGLPKHDAQIACAAAFCVAIAYLLIWTWRGGDWVRAAAWATTGLLLATAWLLPWYLLWPLPLVALSRDRGLQLLVLGLTAYQLGARIPL